MAARKKGTSKSATSPDDVVDAEFVEATPATPAPAAKAKAPKTAKPAREGKVIEAEVVKDDEEGAEPAEESEEVEPAAEELEDVSADVEVKLKPTRSTGLARTDPLAAYMAEVTKHPLLTREEEVALAKRYRDTGDVKAAYKLVASNLRLVVKLAHEYHRNPLALLDLVQEGNIGLMQAVKKFDPERGV